MERDRAKEIIAAMAGGVDPPPVDTSRLTAHTSAPTPNLPSPQGRLLPWLVPSPRASGLQGTA